jgi:Icc-related predicted phosphoesterase
MRIQLVSDVHVEFDEQEPFALPEVERDLLVVAGDLGEGAEGAEFLRRELKRGPVVYVLGNHEFYNHDYHGVRSFWSEIHDHFERQKSGHRLYVLDNKAVTIDGVRFIGSTLWADFDQNHPATKKAAVRGMSDYHCIVYGERLLTPDDAYEAHQTNRAFIAHELSQTALPTVVVTHHAPHPQSTPVGYRDSSVTGCYVSDLSELIEQFTPTVWCHGHTHVRRDYLIGKTRVLCNPRGYARYEETPGFDDSFTFHV